MFCALLTSRYQVSVYRTNGPLGLNFGRIPPLTAKLASEKLTYSISLLAL